MTKKEKPQYDVILVGSGTGNATVAKELSARGKRVLLLEQGSSKPLGGGVIQIARIAREVRVSKHLSVTTAVTLGGSTALYFGVCKLPDLSAFREHGIDLSDELAETLQELPVTRLNEDYLPEQSKRFALAARAMGYSTRFNHMLIDTGQCTHGRYSYDALWRAREFVEQASAQGARVVTGARVTGILKDGDRATGVEYTIQNGLSGRRTERAFAHDVVLGGGAFSTPFLLRKAGLDSVGRQGFFCKPGYMVCGLVDDVKGDDAFVGSFDLDYDEGVSIGDGAMNHSLFRLAMLSNGKFRKAFAHRRIISAGILLDDSLSGELDSDGQYQKSLTEHEQQRLEKAGKDATRILKRAGAKQLFRTKAVGGLPGGSVRFGHHLDQHLQTPVSNLYVCDHSLLFDSSGTPTVPLVCLGKYLARHLTQKYRGAGAIPFVKHQSVAGETV